MDYTTCALPFIGCFCFLLGIGFHVWCMRKPKQQRPAPDEPMPNGLHVLREVKAVVEPKPLERYEREIVQVFIDMERKGTMW